ncbi:MAG: hypothetical protein K2Q10_01060, partial [Rhodospirillales bacterium]|nr:hypothetical protein [Rhodospirillales bacterium]
MRTMLSLTAAATLGLALAATSALADQNAADSLTYSILRNGLPVGSHTVTVRPVEGGATAVETITELAVRSGFSTVYRFQQTGTEEWKDGRLVAMRNVTNDNGRRIEVSAQPAGDGLSVSADGAQAQVVTAQVPASFWNPAVVRQTALLHPIDGRVLNITAKDMGNDSLLAQGVRHKVRHYRLEGDIQREVWFDASGTLVRASETGPD